MNTFNTNTAATASTFKLQLESSETVLSRSPSLISRRAITH